MLWRDHDLVDERDRGLLHRLTPRVVNRPVLEAEAGFLDVLETYRMIGGTVVRCVCRTQCQSHGSSGPREMTQGWAGQAEMWYGWVQMRGARLTLRTVPMRAMKPVCVQSSARVQIDGSTLGVKRSWQEGCHPFHFMSARCMWGARWWRAPILPLSAQAACPFTAGLPPLTRHVEFVVVCAVSVVLAEEPGRVVLCDVLEGVRVVSGVVGDDGDEGLLDELYRIRWERSGLERAYRGRGRLLLGRAAREGAVVGGVSMMADVVWIGRRGRRTRTASTREDPLHRATAGSGSGTGTGTSLVAEGCVAPHVTLRAVENKETDDEVSLRAEFGEGVCVCERE